MCLTKKSLLFFFIFTRNRLCLQNEKLLDMKIRVNNKWWWWERCPNRTDLWSFFLPLQCFLSSSSSLSIIIFFLLLLVPTLLLVCIEFMKTSSASGNVCKASHRVRRERERKEEGMWRRWILFVSCSSCHGFVLHLLYFHIWSFTSA